MATGTTMPLGIDVNLTTSSSFDYTFASTNAVVQLPPVTASAYVRSIAFAMISLIGIASNLTVLILLSRQQTLSLANYLFFFNLAIADLLVSLVCTPIYAVLEVTNGQWVFGDAMCRIIPFIQTLAVGASSFATVAISIERYLAATKPFTYRATSNIWAKRIIIIVVWIAAAIFALPNFFITRVIIVFFAQYKLPFCNVVLPYPNNFIYFASGGILLYIFPIIIVVFCYWNITVAIKQIANGPITKNAEENHKNKLAYRETVITAIIIILLHLLCWAMFYIWILGNLSGAIRLTSVEIGINVNFVARFFAYTNSCWNPIIYVIRGKLLSYRRERARTQRSSTAMSMTNRRKFSTITEYTIAKKDTDEHEFYAEVEL